MYYFLAITAVNVLMSWALYLPYRIAQLHFLTVAVMAACGYGAAFLVTVLHVPFGVALVGACVAGGLFGFVVSVFIGEAPMFAVVIVGFAFIYIFRTVIQNMPALGGTLGMFGLPDIGGDPSTHRAIMLAILVAALLVGGFYMRRFDHSGLGRAASAAFKDPRLASTLGVNVKALGMILQSSSCLLAGGCGVLYAFIYKSIDVDFFGFPLVGTLMTILFVGGYATPWGALVAAPILYGVPLLLPNEIAAWQNVIYGALLVIVLLVRPEGLVTRRLVRYIETSLFHGRRRSARLGG